MVVGVSASDPEFWGNRLEVNTGLIKQRHADPEYLLSWVDNLAKRARKTLVQHLRVSDFLSVRAQRAALLRQPSLLLTAMLAEAATAGKQACVIDEVARSRLTPEQVASCQLPTGKFDRLAVTWLLYCDAPRNLERIFHLDCIQKRGFARMVLDPQPIGQGRSATAFFTIATIQDILEEHERQERTGRRSSCTEILSGEKGTFQVFIKRDAKSYFISHGPENTFGFQREWMVLEFEPDLQRVRMCSVSHDVPALLANRIAARFFGFDVNYVNESVFTDIGAVKYLLRSLIDRPERLPLVEMVTRNCGLVNSPSLRLNDTDNCSLAPAIKHFSTAFGDLVDHVADIECLRVHCFGRRVKLVFEVGEGEDAVVVRYGDQPLTSNERREFERLMLEDYGITVLSTEKRHAC